MAAAGHPRDDVHRRHRFRVADLTPRANRAEIPSHAGATQLTPLQRGFSLVRPLSLNEGGRLERHPDLIRLAPFDLAALDLAIRENKIELVGNTYWASDKQTRASV